MFLDLEFGAGYATDTGVRASVYARDRSLDDLRPEPLGLCPASARSSRITQLEMREPHALETAGSGREWLTASHLFKENPSFNLKKTALIAGINQEILERSTVSFQYEFSLNETFDVEPDRDHFAGGPGEGEHRGCAGPSWSSDFPGTTRSRPEEGHVRIRGG